MVEFTEVFGRPNLTPADLEPLSAISLLDNAENVLELLPSAPPRQRGAALHLQTPHGQARVGEIVQDRFPCGRRPVKIAFLKSGISQPVGGLVPHGGDEIEIEDFL